MQDAVVGTGRKREVVLKGHADQVGNGILGLRHQFVLGRGRVEGGCRLWIFRLGGGGPGGLLESQNPGGEVEADAGIRGCPASRPAWAPRAGAAIRRVSRAVFQALSWHFPGDGGGVERWPATGQGSDSIQPTSPVALLKSIDLIVGPATIGESRGELRKILQTLKSFGKPTGLETAVGVGSEPDAMTSDDSRGMFEVIQAVLDGRGAIPNELAAEEVETDDPVALRDGGVLVVGQKAGIVFGERRRIGVGGADRPTAAGHEVVEGRAGEMGEIVPDSMVVECPHQIPAFGGESAGHRIATRMPRAQAP